MNPVSLYAEIAHPFTEGQTVGGDGMEKYLDFTAPETLDDISEENLKKISEDALGRVEAYQKNQSFYDAEIDNFSVLGYYLLNAKDEDVSLTDSNSLFVVCRGEVSSKRGEFDTVSYYFPVYYKGVVCMKDDIMYCETEGIAGRSKPAEDSWDCVDGFLEGKEMFKELVEKNCDKYSYDMSEELEEFGK